MTSTTATATPVHLLPTSCHVCGSPVPKREGASRPDCWHDFTNAEADASAAAHDARVTLHYPSGATTPEQAAVLQHAPDAATL